MKAKVIEGMLKEELERNIEITACYMEELSRLPKGTLVKRVLKDQTYYYLHYRENKKVVSKYIGKLSDDELMKLEKQIQKRKNIEFILKKLKIEAIELEKILK